MEPDDVTGEADQQLEDINNQLVQLNQQLYIMRLKFEKQLSMMQDDLEELFTNAQDDLKQELLFIKDGVEEQIGKHLKTLSTKLEDAGTDIANGMQSIGTAQVATFSSSLVNNALSVVIIIMLACIIYRQSQQAKAQKTKVSNAPKNVLGGADLESPPILTFTSNSKSMFIAGTGAAMPENTSSSENSDQPSKARLI